MLQLHALVPGHAWGRQFWQSNWAAHNNWCNPPFSLIGDLLAILEEQSAEATVVVPFWSGQPWWATLMAAPGRFAEFVQACVELPRLGDTFLPGASNANQAGVGSPNWRVLALRISFMANMQGRVLIPPLTFPFLTFFYFILLSESSACNPG